MSTVPRPINLLRYANQETLRLGRADYSWHHGDECRRLFGARVERAFSEPSSADSGSPTFEVASINRTRHEQGAWQVSLWYQELALLYLLDHNGEYRNRMSAEAVGEVHTLQWWCGPDLNACRSLSVGELCASNRLAMSPVQSPRIANLWNRPMNAACSPAPSPSPSPTELTSQLCQPCSMTDAVRIEAVCERCGVNQH